MYPVFDIDAVDAADAAICARALALLACNAELAPGSVGVRVTRGHLTLHGHVTWPYQRASAEASVSGLGGATGVANRITVQPKSGPPREDRCEEATSHGA